MKEHVKIEGGLLSLLVLQKNIKGLEHSLIIRNPVFDSSLDTMFVQHGLRSTEKNFSEGSPEKSYAYSDKTMPREFFNLIFAETRMVSRALYALNRYYEQKGKGSTWHILIEPLPPSETLGYLLI